MRRLSWIAERVTLLMGAYHRADFDNAEIFASTCVAILQKFPNPVIESVTDPGSGLQTRSNYPPRSAELNAACERSLRSFSVIEQHRARKLAKEAREREANPPKPEVPRPTLEDLTLKYPELLGPLARIAHRTNNGPKMRSIEEIADEMGIERGAIYAIPDLKPGQGGYRALGLKPLKAAEIAQSVESK